MKLIMILLASTLLSGCVTWVDQNGNPASQYEEFDCDSRCGLYTPGGTGVMVGICTSNCMRAKGFHGK